MTFTDSLRSELDERSSVPLYRQLAIAIRDAIETGRLKPGDRLDSERLLTDQLGLSRSTVRAALGELAENGLITSTQGRGSFVQERPTRRNVRILIPERFRPADLGPHPMHYDLLHLVASQTECRIRYEYVPDPAHLGSVLAHAVEEYQAAVIFRPVQTWLDALLPLAGKAALPVLVISRDLGGSGLQYVTPDHFGGSRDATETLLAHGHRRIAYIGSEQGEAFARQTFLGHQAAMGRFLPLPPPEWCLEVPITCTVAETTERIAAFLQALRPEAVSIGGSRFVLPFEAALQRLRWRAPEQVSAVAYTEPTMLEDATLPWSAIVQPLEAVARLAFEQLCAQVRGQHPGPIRHALPNEYRPGDTLAPRGV